MVVLLWGLLAAACDAPPELRPDPLLADSLGLTARDRVHTVVLTMEAGREVARPDTVQIRPGDWVEFRSGDGFVRLLRFDPDSLDPAPREWMRVRGLSASPPLVNSGTRWVVHFQEAPPGRYLYLLDGSRLGGSGVVVVDAGRRFPFYNR